MTAEHGVVIAGGGPVGMVLASELRLAGVDVLVLERRPNQELGESRAGGIQARAIELLDMRGAADRFLSAGQTAQAAAFASVSIDISDFPSRHPYTLALFQNHMERILAEWLREIGVVTRYGAEVSGFSQDASGVEVALAGGDRLRAQYLVGCDGGRSLVRRLAGIEFPGTPPTVSNLIAELEVTEETPKGVRQDATGIHAVHVFGEGRRVRIVTTEREVGGPEEPTLDDLKRNLVAIYGTDFGAHSPASISRFTDSTRQAASYRAGRVLLAGDSAHVHSPAGGQGLTIGFQDAFNLGWKLARVVRGISSEALLDTYHAERQPAGARSLRYTMAQGTFTRPDEGIDALRRLVGELVPMDEPRRHLGGLISGLDAHYDLGPGHPQLGRRMPDLDLLVEGRAARVFELMRDGRPLFLNLGSQGAFEAVAWPPAVKRVDARFEGAWELPVLGAVPAPEAVLVRPDGHVAWVGEKGRDGLEVALATWFG